MQHIAPRLRKLHWLLGCGGMPRSCWSAFFPFFNSRCSFCIQIGHTFCSHKWTRFKGKHCRGVSLEIKSNLIAFFFIPNEESSAFWNSRVFFPLNQKCITVHCVRHNTTGCHDSHQQNIGQCWGNGGQSVVNNCHWMTADNALLYIMPWSYTVGGRLGSQATQQHVACYSADALMPTCPAT